MKKIGLLCMLLPLLSLILTLSYPTVNTHAAAANTRVRVRIEGADRTLASGTTAVHATLRESLEEIAAAEGLTLTFVQSGGESTLTGVDGLPEKGQWMGYIIRRGQIIRQDDYLSLPLQNGDEVVVYLGAAEETRVVTHFTCEQVGDALRFFVGAVETVWAEQDGDWTPSTTVRPIEQARIHLGLPGQEPVTLQTNADGYAEAALALFAPDTPVGAAAYYAEGYRAEGLPLIVRTAVHHTPFGFASDKGVTRAEAIAFLTHMYPLDSTADAGAALSTDATAAADAPPDQPAPDEAMPFSDIDEETPWLDEIRTAADRGLVFGYEDGTFRPDTAADLLQLCVLTARLFPALYDEGPPMDGLPDWAADAAGGLYHAGLLIDIGMAWTRSATPETMVQLYLNVTGYGSN